MGHIHVQKTQKNKQIKRQKRVITFTVRQKGKREREGGMSASETFLLHGKVGHERPEVKNVTPTLCLFLLRPVLLTEGE